ncbi:hypothetical protein AB0H49_10455 [Nocardia sp. NPDC050713]|uniref:hypothetical protein n=1 Tax=Nocardia sp. NPDC050713 TaxID=3154511 RepID=UPI0033FE6F16
MNTIEQIIKPLRDLDWNNTEAVHTATRPILDELATDRQLLRTSALAPLDDQKLLSLCEHYDILDKIVLSSDPSGIRLRLHVFQPGYYDRPHNHRWTYSSRILRGRYLHRLYGDAELDSSLHPGTLHAVQVREEVVGSSYTLSHKAIHAVVADPGTVSLVVRGPAVADRFLVMDAATGAAWWQYGAALESEDDSRNKRMSRERMREVIDQLIDWMVL